MSGIGIACFNLLQIQDMTMNHEEAMEDMENSHNSAVVALREENEAALRGVCASCVGTAFPRWGRQSTHLPLLNLA